MKTLTLFTIFVLIFGTTSPLLVNDAHAQNDPSILLRIAKQADKQIENQLQRVYGDSVPQNIQSLYDQGHLAVISLEDSLNDNNITQAKKDFLSAMKIFQQISRIISEPSTEAKVTTRDTADRDLTSELNRLHKYFQNLEAISKRYDTGINFDQIYELFEKGREQIRNGDNEGAKNTIGELKLLLNDIQKNIREHASNSATKRIKQFLEKQLDKIESFLDKAEPSENTRTAYDLIVKIQLSLSEDNLSDAKSSFSELIKLVKVIQKANR
ncbi:hypothetical protein NsoK4_09035 [Nitrosopumilus sp. K4]|uniref:hypothetical protein n=1 Tax=Nitrosopumilus sp. K4 TaxID=2795383 RepID=UPI001BA53A25|nr:hypothetical protein [Nitrosopumilus sp. K4]QUC64551.1 hypothetical protein NsoK4_09035 [Nitrosopumilus sp. K4]